jgi:hypothetical protein
MATRREGRTMDRLAGTGAVHTHDGSSLSVWPRAWHFLRHGLEMGAAMWIGMAALDPVYSWVAGLLGYANPLLQLPELSALVVAFNMTVPMAAWMRFRGMEWRPIAEMSAAMLAEAILIIGAYWLGILANNSVGGTTSLIHLQHCLMVPAMLVPMLARRDVYTGVYTGKNRS